MIEHPDISFQKVHRVQQGSSKHKRFKRIVSQLSDPQKRETILNLREIIRLVSAGLEHKAAILQVYSNWWELELWKSPSLLKD